MLSLFRSRANFPQVMMNFLRDFEKSLDIKITCSQETEPMGTAGPLALARDKLDDGSGESFFVLNSDVISEYPLQQMIDFHKRHGAEATIMVTKVQYHTSSRDDPELVVYVGCAHDCSVNSTVASTGNSVEASRGPYNARGLSMAVL